jgi:hypothetical protein
MEQDGDEIITGTLRRYNRHYLYIGLKLRISLPEQITNCVIYKCGNIVK